MSRRGIAHEERYEDKLLDLRGDCYVCLQPAPDASVHAELRVRFCPPCHQRAQAVRCKPIPGRRGPGRTRPLAEWRSLLIAMRPKAMLLAIAKVLRTTALDDAVGVVMRGGDLTAIVDRAEQALLSTQGIYQRSGVLTRAIKLDRAIGDTPRDVKREMGSTMLITVNETWLIEQMGKTLKWFSSSNGSGPVPADPKPLYARTLLKRGEWRFPVLRGVVTAPTLARDGRIIETPGFDRESGLLMDILPGSFPPVSVNPMKDDALAALERLAHPLRDFPFVSDAAKSVALSALLTALVRMSLMTAPLHGFDAPAAGTGKSLLAEMAGLLASGFKPPALSQGKSEEEDEKRLSTILFAGDPVIHIDNCDRAITGDFLCSMLTQEIVQARILGLSERRVLPCTALVLASGNNLTLAGDTSRRAVMCRLDAGVEKPENRRFSFDCHEEVKAGRPELVVAGLTILRAYIVAGKPEKLTPMGSFDHWEWIRGALVWLGCAEPEGMATGGCAANTSRGRRGRELDGTGALMRPRLCNPHGDCLFLDIFAAANFLPGHYGN